MDLGEGHGDVSSASSSESSADSETHLVEEGVLGNGAAVETVDLGGEDKLRQPHKKQSMLIVRACMHVHHVVCPSYTYI